MCLRVCSPRSWIRRVRECSKCRFHVCLFALGLVSHALIIHLRQHRRCRSLAPRSNFTTWTTFIVGSPASGGDLCVLEQDVCDELCRRIWRDEDFKVRAAFPSFLLQTSYRFVSARRVLQRVLPLSSHGTDYFSTPHQLSVCRCPEFPAETWLDPASEADLSMNKWLLWELT